MKITSTILALGALLLLGGVATAQASYTVVPDGSSANDITPDGKWIVGTGFASGTGGFGYRWDWKNSATLENLDTTLTTNQSRPVAVSDDGTVILGTVTDDLLIPGGTGTDRDVAGLWTESTGDWVSLGYLPAALSCPSRSSPYDLSADGSAAVGLSWDGCFGRAFYWTQATGMTELQVVGNDRNRASAISANGAVICGFAQGNFSRTPAYWFSDGTGFVFNADDLGEFYGTSDDGAWLYGTRNGDAVKFHIASQTYTVLGLNGGDTAGTGQLTSGWVGNATDGDEPCFEADRTIVGFENLQAGLNGFIWSSQTGMVSLNDMMAMAGVAGVPLLSAPAAITPDGTTVVGATSFFGAWVLELPTGVASVNPGCGGNPAGSLEVLCGQPRLGTSMVIGLQNPLGSMSPGALSRLTFSVGQFPGCGPNLPGYGMAFNGAPGELIITLPKILTVSGANWDGANPAAVPVVIPSNPPLHGVTVYAQGALVDVAGGVHIGLTEGLELTFGGW